MEVNIINHQFEAEKTRKALLYTAIFCGLFLIIAIFYTWPMQVPPTPTVMDLIDVNLGNEQEGLGDVQPLVKGDRAPDNQSVPAAHSTSHKVTEEPSQNIQADEDDKNEEAAPVVKNDKKIEKAKVENKEPSVKPTKSVHPSPVVNPNPAPPKPKIPLYKGGTGNGGNGAT